MTDLPARRDDTETIRAALAPLRRYRLVEAPKFDAVFEEVVAALARLAAPAAETDGIRRELTRRTVAIRELAHEEDHADDLDDRTGLRHRRNDEERYLGRWVAENAHAIATSLVAAPAAAEETRTLTKLREAVAEIAHFQDGQLIERQAHLLREKARIALADSWTRDAILSNDAETLAEITGLWADYCRGDLDMGALAQELGETLNARAALQFASPLAATEETRLREALDEAHTDVHGQALDDALAYVEMRQEVLGTDDPLSVLAGSVLDARRVLDAALSPGSAAQPAEEQRDE